MLESCSRILSVWPKASKVVVADQQNELVQLTAIYHFIDQEML